MVGDGISEDFFIIKGRRGIGKSEKSDEFETPSL